MKQVVLEAFPSFTIRFEGKTHFLYLDCRGLVTSGIGNLLEPMALAEVLPWKHPNGTRARVDEIQAAWHAVKDRKDLAKLGGGDFAALTTIRLDDAAIAALVNSKLLQHEAIVRGRFPGFDGWPADAQLATLSMAWSMGPDFRFPRFEAAVNATPPNFDEARAECAIDESGNPGVKPRNAANRSLFSIAAIAVRGQANPNILHLTDVFRGS